MYYCFAVFEAGPSVNLIVYDIAIQCCEYLRIFDVYMFTFKPCVVYFKCHSHFQRTRVFAIQRLLLLMLVLDGFSLLNCNGLVQQSFLFSLPLNGSGIIFRGNATKGRVFRAVVIGHP